LVRRAEVQQQLIDAKNKGELTDELINELVMDNWPKGKRLPTRILNLRTFISQESGRNQLVSHVYDITYGVIREKKDALVCIDDSIVRGTTLKQSILKFWAVRSLEIVDRFHRSPNSLSGLLWNRYV
jgi:amidophosphoribosyltransferase